MALGNVHTCVLLSGGGVICRGNDIFGQLGIGGFTDANNKKIVNLGTGARNRHELCWFLRIRLSVRCACVSDLIPPRQVSRPLPSWCRISIRARLLLVQA